MRAIVVSKPTDFGLATLPQPQCGRGQALIRTAYYGICGTDLEILRRSIDPGLVRYPIVPGHEWTGVVVELGHDVSNLGSARESVRVANWREFNNRGVFRVAGLFFLSFKVLGG
jgi:D-arabinose 1-dehydrogenase-like Zn-dependent alcohol dehydrogenase